MSASPPRLLVARGARHAEEILLAEALGDAAAPATSDDLAARLGAPLHIVVPSQSLRLHVLERLVRTAGSSVVGIQCHTHYGLALRILDSLDLGPPRGLDLFPILARRFARREEDLAASLDHLREGYSGILPAVRDLLDAGFAPGHLEALEEAIAEEDDAPMASDEIARAQALGRVTARTLLAFTELGVGRVSTLLQAATGGVKTRADTALASRGILLHGFADATGVAADFLTALLEAYGGCVVLDRPPDPLHPEQEDPSSEFTMRLAERFRGLCELETPPSGADAPRIELYRALGEESELREVAQRCLDLIDEGTAPESIGIVMREPRPYRSLLRRVFEDLALPYSTIGLDAPVGPVGRRIRAWLEIVTQGSRCHVERWLDTLPERFESVPLFDLRVALAALGVSRLDQLVELDLEAVLDGASYPLPVRRGFFEAEEEAEGAKVVRASRRHVPAGALRSLVAAGRRLAGVLEDWRREAMPLDGHVDYLRRVTLELGWTPERPEAHRLAELFETLLAAPPVAIDQDELVLTVRRLTTELDREPLGGRGGGVRVMGVVEARGLTFEHLFVLGMNRGVFPRTVREDPVLSDALRQRLARGGHGLLPDLPIKRRGYQEERYLFAHLLSAAPRVTLSWLEVDDDDRPKAASPLVERLRWSHSPEAADWRDPPVVGRRMLLDQHPEEDTRRRRASRLAPREQLVLAALDGPREGLPNLFASILGHRARDEDDDSIDWMRVARARRAVIDELDPPGFEAAQSCLSPYLGFVGPADSTGDPRRNRRIYVTTIEGMATCPWQTFLERLLRVEAVPDPLDALPQIDPLMIGIAVHRVLERIVAAGLGAAVSASPERLEELLDRSARQVGWPEEDLLERLLTDEAEATVRASGVALRGFSRALAAVARPYLEMARRIEWNDGEISSLGAEVQGALGAAAPAGTEHLISFRADRVDRQDDEVVLIDYKTGTLPYTQSRASYRRKRYLKDLASGARLQPAVYAAALAERSGRGRFSFLKPQREVPEAARTISVASDDADARRPLEHVLSTVLDSWQRGLFFPRLELPGASGNKPAACNWCRVAEACLQGDSGVRRRMRLGMERLASLGPELDPAERAALLEQWWLAAPEARPTDLPIGER